MRRDCSQVTLTALPSKRLGLFAADGTLIARSDSNGEDLEAFAGAGAGLMDSDPHPDTLGLHKIARQCSCQLKPQPVRYSEPSNTVALPPEVLKPACCTAVPFQTDCATRACALHHASAPLVGSRHSTLVCLQGCTTAFPSRRCSTARLTTPSSRCCGTWVSVTRCSSVIVSLIICSPQVECLLHYSHARCMSRSGQAHRC